MWNRRVFLGAGALGLRQARGAGKYKAVIIGHTGHGNYGHDWDLSWNSFPNVEVAAVADPDASGRERAMRRSRAARGYSDYREMFGKERPDVVTICPRWMDERGAMVRAAAEAGAHILMEKPFARNLREADEIVGIVERRRVKLQVGHTARPLGVTKQVRKMLADGVLGALMEVRARGKEDRRAGGEDLMVLGTHTFDLLRYYCGDPEWVFAHMTEKGRAVRPGMEREATEPVGQVAGDNIAAVFGFAGGVHGYFASKASDVVDGKRFGVTLYGSKAVLFVPLSDVPSAAPYLLRSSAWAGERWERIGYPPGQEVQTREQANAAMAADLLDAIEHNRDPICSHRDGLWTIEMVAGIYQSQYAGAPVRFPLVKRK